MKVYFKQALMLKWAFYFSGYLMLAAGDWYTALSVFVIHCGISLSIKTGSVEAVVHTLINLKNDDNNEEDTDE